MREDYAIAADLCEEHGLVTPTRVLRQIAEGTGEIFMVRPDDFDTKYGVLSGPLVQSIFRTRRIFPTRAAAESCAAQLKAALLREYRYSHWMEPYLFALASDEFCRRVGVALGTEYRLPEEGAPLMPTWATDEQLRAIADLVRESLVEVVSIPLQPPSEA